MKRNERGTFGTREVNGVWLEVFPLTFGRARLTVSLSSESVVYLDGW